MKKKLLFSAIIAVVALWGANVDAAIMMNGEEYESIQAAITAAGNTASTITVTENVASGAGFITQDGQNITIDFQGNTYVTGHPTVGSTGTETLGMQLLKGSTVTLKNGKVKCDTDNCKIVVQNYSDLTLIDMTVDASHTGGQYAVSNNNGSLTVKGNTNLIGGQYAAFDLWYGMSSTYADGITVTFGEDYTGTVTGNIEYGAASWGRTQEGWREKAVLNIAAGTFNGQIVAGSTGALEGASINITGGTFASVDENYVPDTSVVYTNTDTGMEVVVPEDELVIMAFDEAMEPTEEETTKINEALEQGYVVGKVLDVTAWLTNPEDNNAKVEQVTSDTGMVNVTISVADLPTLQEGYTRTYKIIRIHNGEATTLGVVDNGDGTITFQTDLFSTYAVTYVDQAPATGAGEEEQTNNPNTADKIILYISALVISASVVTGTALYLNKRY